MTTPSKRAALCAVATACALAAPSRASAETQYGSTSPIDRPHTIAELEAGIIALPNAPISPAQRGGDTPLVGTIGKGDATIQTGLHLLYRGAKEWAIGAGFVFAPRPTADSEYGGLRSLPRTHSRSYLFIGTELRYVPLHFRTFEVWGGLTAGGVVVADRFVTDAGDPVPTILGQKDITVRTEGFGVGVQAGVDWMFTDQWVAGLTARTDRWLLPSSPQCTPIGDCATLTGAVAAYEFGLKIGFRIPL